MQNKKEQLIEFLTSWFAWVRRNNKNKEPRFWSKNSIARLLKLKLKELNHWKDNPRGNPSKGFRGKESNKKIKITLNTP